MDDLRRAVVDRCEAHPDRAELTVALDDAIADLEALIDSFDRPLFDLLGAAEAAPDHGVRDESLRRAAAHVAQGRERFARDDLVELMDTNGFLELGLRSILDAALAQLSRGLGVEAAAGNGGPDPEPPHAAQGSTGDVARNERPSQKARPGAGS